ncbi:MAG: RagB/SusD family nutrient uptake outer membrane protein, partial [Petrimonas sp.]
PLIILCIIGICLQGCNDFLDLAPDDRTEINSLDKVNQTLVGAYQNERGFRFTFWSSDNATLVDGVPYNESIIEDLYTWSKNIRNQQHQDSPTEYWHAAYYSIAHVNRILKALDELEATPKTAEERQRADGYRGEALIIRAYNHFMLVNLFGKHYNPATADTDLGVPYATEPENRLIVDYPRLTVKETYDKIENDIKDGLSLIEKAGIMKQNNKYRFTLPTVYTFASRFYTFRNAGDADVKAAVQYAEKAIQTYGGLDKMRLWSDYFQDPMGFVDINRPDVGLIQASYSWVPFNWKYSITFTIFYLLINEERWINPTVFYTDSRLMINYQRQGDIWMPVFYFEPTGNSEDTAIDLFPLSEAILLGAEGYARLGDFEQYKICMEAIAKSVYIQYDSRIFTLQNLNSAYNEQAGIYHSDKDKNAMIAYCLFERRMMSLMKGMRWFDIRRYNMEVEHPTDDGTVLKLSEKNPDRVFQIPEYAIKAGMKGN